MTVEETESAVLVQQASRAAIPASVPQGVSTLVVDHLDKVVLVNDEATQPTPLRKIGLVTFYDSASLSTYVNRHKGDGTVLYVDERNAKVQAVLNDHSPDAAGWGDHVADLEVRKTEAWIQWQASNDKFLEQEAFAEHIERNLIDIVEPAGADLLELAQTFQATTKVEFRSSRLLVNGQRQFEYVESTDASGGKKGELTIPKEFKLGIAPYEGVDNYGVSARLRYRIADGGRLRLAYVLDNPQDVERAAFTDIAKEIEAAVEVPTLAGVVSRRYDPRIVTS